MLESQAEELLAEMEAEVRSLPVVEQQAFMVEIQEYRRRLAKIRERRLQLLWEEIHEREAEAAGLILDLGLDVSSTTSDKQQPLLDATDCVTEESDFPLLPPPAEFLGVDPSRPWTAADPGSSGLWKQQTPDGGGPGTAADPGSSRPWTAEDPGRWRTLDSGGPGMVADPGRRQMGCRPGRPRLAGKWLSDGGSLFRTAGKPPYGGTPEGATSTLWMTLAELLGKSG
jgi:hypothetical protein